MDWHSLHPQDVVQQLQSNAQQGLQPGQVRQRLQADGANALVARQKGRWLLRFLAQFKDFMVLALLAAAAISAISALVHGNGDYLDSIIIAGIVTVNAIVGVLQEGRAEKALDALQKLSAPTAMVLRAGQKLRVKVEELVRGDILLLAAGDQVPADCRLLEAQNLSTQESALTGESLPVKKDAHALFAPQTPLGDRSNSLLSTTLVLSGHGKAVVTATGMQTEVGRIAQLLNQESAPQTPLQQRLETVGRQLGLGAMAISAFLFLLGFVQHVPALESFMLAISLAVAAIPEGLPAMVTVVLSLGVQRMAKAGAIVRRLPAVETLGCATAICSDKTGTLTQNKMTVVELRDAQGLLGNSKDATAKKLLRLASLCSNAELHSPGNGPKGGTGEPTELAIVEAAAKRHIAVMQERAQFKRLQELAFDSDRKRMAVLCQFGPAGSNAPLPGTAVLVKGAPDILLPRCVLVEQNGTTQALSEPLRQQILYQNEQMANAALRVIAVGYRCTNELREEQLVFLGLIGMEDPPRREARQAVKRCKKAGIVPIMITGDHMATANAIARQLGILEPEHSALASMTGAELGELSDAALADRLKVCRVFARVTPEHKMRIVKALRAQRHVVAMTGDGVNDAPALKAADIGCAMGKSGTEVAKGAADMILTDDNFATIVHAIEEGRGIYDNMKKAVRFLISSNMGEIVAVLLASLLRMPAPLLPIQLLWVNVVTDSAPAIALGMEPTDPQAMTRPPKPVEQSFFDRGMALRMALDGLLMGTMTLLGFVLGRRVLGVCNDDLTMGRTMAFSILSFVEIFQANNMRSARSLLQTGLFSNRRMNFANVLCAALQIAVVAVPGLCEMFGTTPMHLPQWITVLALAACPTLLIECEKLWFARKTRFKTKKPHTAHPMA